MVLEGGGPVGVSEPNHMSEGSVSVKVATTVGLGAIIGAGIFTLSGTVIALAGPWAPSRSSSWALSR
jgi:amino acid transporter